MNELLKKLPDISALTKSEMLDMLLKEEYGTLPSRPYSVSAELESCDENFCAGNAELKKLRFTCKADFGEYTFPLYYVCPKGKNEPVPAFVHINFRDLIPDRYQPTEEIIDEGYATLTFCYKDVSSDDGDFSNGLAGVVYPDGIQSENGCGKIGLWAWAASAVMDYAQTLPELDHARISVTGHSRLGKTALLAGAIDERFFCAFSNDSGCSGASISRESYGETIEVITRVFPYWFCKNYRKYANNEDTLPFDQHYLIAANVPHRVYVASAELDDWACPRNEYLSCVAASKYYEDHTGSGFVAPVQMPKSGDFFHEGNIGYHIRSGKHYQGRADWIRYIQYLNSCEERA